MLIRGAPEIEFVCHRRQALEELKPADVAPIGGLRWAGVATGDIVYIFGSNFLAYE